MDFIDEGWTFLSEQVQKGNPIAFGSNVPRKMFPMHTAPDRMGIEMGLRGAPHRGPGLHQPHPVVYFLYPLNVRPKSKKGWYFGARTGTRSKELVNTVPGPNEYQRLRLTTPYQTSRPFGRISSRFSMKDYQTISPGPGRYNNDAEPDNEIEFHYSFGGRKEMKETARIKCTKGIPEKCSSCNCNLAGDYYENKNRDNHCLCPQCFDAVKNAKDPMREKKARLYSKVRDCSSIHKHEFPGFSPKLLIRSDKETKKLKQKEAYLRVYFPD